MTFVQSIGLTTPLPAGERVDRTFKMVEAVAPGEYVVEDDVGIEFAGDGEGGTLAYRVVLQVTETAVAGT